jgi:4-alpha-glucanotransferase
MTTSRASGILCHPTALPGPFGIGDLGHGCDALLDFCHDAGQTIWQILPLVPTGYGDSPYQPFSVFAGNPLLIDLQQLVDEGLLTPDEARADPPLPTDHVDYGAVIQLKDRALRCASRTLGRTSGVLADEMRAFEQENAAWLEDYCLFMALKLHYRWAVWPEWERDIALCRPDAVAAWRERLADEVSHQRLMQFLFDRQWQRVRREAQRRDIRIMGDVPIFVGHDSADVWSHQELFELDGEGRPTVVAGVPPDYFSPTGQLWGNPHYRWDVMAQDDYAWWVSRLRRTLSQIDLVRIDHFRGFAAYWQVKAGEETAANGQWIPGPGQAFFDAVQRQMGSLPIIAEDLGLITEDVIALRQRYGLPGMRVLQFAFDSDGANEHLPHNHTSDCVIYTGTHDNDTTLGWYATRDARTQHKARLYSGCDGSAMHWSLIRLAMTSVADTAIISLQDVLGLGSEARFNTPGQAHGNWSWRFDAAALRPELASALRELAEVTGRWQPPRIGPEEEEDAAEAA